MRTLPRCFVEIVRARVVSKARGLIEFQAGSEGRLVTERAVVVEQTPSRVSVARANPDEELYGAEIWNYLLPADGSKQLPTRSFIFCALAEYLYRHPVTVLPRNTPNPIFTYSEGD